MAFLFPGYSSFQPCSFPGHVFTPPTSHSPRQPATRGTRGTRETDHSSCQVFGAQARANEGKEASLGQTDPVSDSRVGVHSDPGDLGLALVTETK